MLSRQTQHAENFRKLIVAILEEKADLPSLEIFRRVREAGYPGGNTTLVASLRAKEHLVAV